MSTEATTEHKCYCPDDCNCRKPWRTTYCGCKAHTEDEPEPMLPAQQSPLPYSYALS